MLFGLFFGDWTILILIPAMIFTVIAQIKVGSVFERYQKLTCAKGITGAEAARRILDSNGLYHVSIERVRGHLSDHYDPRTNVIRLSESTYDSAGIAAVGVAAHEAGHAIQYAKGYLPIKIRGAIIPITSFGSRLAIPLFLIGLLLTSFSLVNGTVGEYMMLAGIVLFSLTTLFQLVTLPTEFNASRRALRALADTGVLYEEELGGARQVLTAAAMTYVAALATSLAYLLRFILIASSASRRRR